MFYSKSTNGFYDIAIHGENIPKDALEITAEEHAALLEGQSSGKLIVADKKGRPILQDPPPPSEEQLAIQVRSERDRLFKEVYDLALVRILRDLRLANSPDEQEAIKQRINAWDAYALALQNIPKQPGFPSQVRWPDIPD